MNTRFEREHIMIKVGEKVYCNWGAMLPTEERTVLKIEGGRMWCERRFHYVTCRLA